MKQALLCTLLLSSLAAHDAPAADAKRGEAEYRAHCFACHSIGCNRRGPKLQDVFGRKAAALADFTYTDSMKKSGIVWTDESMDAFLSDPAKAVPGTSMTFGRVTNENERREIIAFIRLQDRSIDLC